MGNPGIRHIAARDQAGKVERRRPRQQLLPNLAAQHPGGIGASQRDASGDRNQQRRNHRHQPVAHGEHGVGARRFAQVDPLLQRADQQAGDDVDGSNKNRGQRIALVEARRAIHRAVELGFARDRLAAAPGFGFIDEAGVHVGIDGHLLAGQRVQREARRDLGGAHRAMRDHQELDGDQGQKQHEADNIVAAHDELSEGLDHLAGGGGSF